MELKQYHFFQDYEIKDLNSREGTLTVTASDETVDRVNEILIASGCQYPEDGRVVGLWQHNRRSDLPPIFKTTWITNIEQRVRAGIQFTRDKFAQQIFNLYKEKFMTDFSVGFLPNHERSPNSGEKNKGARRVVDRWEFIELSSVVIGANINARAEEKTERLIRLKYAIDKGKVELPQMAYKDFGFEKLDEFVTFKDPTIQLTEEDIERLSKKIIKELMLKKAKEILDEKDMVNFKDSEIVTFRDPD